MTVYSGAVKQGWDEEKSYHRLQYSGFVEKSELDNFIIESIAKFKQSERSRLDLRIRINDFTDFDLLRLHESFPELEIVPLYDQQFGEIIELTIGYNNKFRVIPRQHVLDLKQLINRQVETAVANRGNFPIFAAKQLERMREKSIGFADEINSEHLYLLWNRTFGWDLDSCESYAKKEVDSIGKVFGLKDNQGRLIAAVLNSYSDNAIESTEWSVLPEYRGAGLITPLLIHANSYEVALGKERPLYAHLRIGRSVTPGINSGMRIYRSTHASSTDFLSNHVTVSIDEKADAYNQFRPCINGLEDSHALRSFVMGQLDVQLYTPDITDKFL